MPCISLYLASSRYISLYLDLSRYISRTREGMATAQRSVVALGLGLGLGSGVGLGSGLGSGLGLGGHGVLLHYKDWAGQAIHFRRLVESGL